MNDEHACDQDCDSCPYRLQCDEDEGEFDDDFEDEDDEEEY